MNLARTRLDPAYVRQQIDLLRSQWPEIWDDPDGALLTDTLEGETNLLEFLTGHVDAMHGSENHKTSLDLRIEAYKNRAQHFAMRVEALRTLAFKLMQHANLTKLELAPATLSIRQGTPKVVITDEAALPEDCIRIKREPNKIRIKELIDQGVTVPGASLSNAEPVLAMRTK